MTSKKGFGPIVIGGIGTCIINWAEALQDTESESYSSFDLLFFVKTIGPTNHGTSLDL